MKTPYLLTFASVLIGCLLLGTSHAQTLIISGGAAKPVTLQAADLTAMPHREVVSKDHDGKDHRYSGVPLIELLKQAGVSTGPALRGKNLMNCVVVKAADGYEVLFALPELDPEFASRVILLADQVDGGPLPGDTGPFRLVVPDEKKAARWVRQVRAIDVRLVK